MLKGIDISSWQGNIDLSKLAIDFVICKATEGLNYTNPYCDPKIQQAVKLGKLWGFYHYAKANDPEKEAQRFIDATKGYDKKGIPVLDWEENQSVDWVNKFVRYYHAKTGVWPWVYASYSYFKSKAGVEENCGRWVACYPSIKNPNFSSDVGSVPKIGGVTCAWQFASDGRITGYAGDLDLSYFFGDSNAWKKYANPASGEPAESAETSVLENGDYIVTIERK